MNQAPEDLHHRLDQLRVQLATETTDPIAEGGGAGHAPNLTTDSKLARDP
jgi:hypothetical protein